MSIFFSFIFTSKIFSIDKQYILKKIESLTIEERNDLTFFLKFCFHSTGFGYTIFGEKPISLEAISSEKPQIDDIEDKYKDWILWSYKKKDGWDVWTKHFKDIPLNNYSLLSYPYLSEPEVIHIMLVNHKFFLEAVKNHLTEFQNILNLKINPEEILKGFITKNKEIFEPIKNHDGLLGILLGYGKENSWKFMKREKLYPSIDSEVAHWDASNILLPFFMTVKNSQETKKIMKSFDLQREKINKIYQSENFLELTLLKLFSNG